MKSLKLLGYGLLCILLQLSINVHAQVMTGFEDADDSVLVEKIMRSVPPKLGNNQLVFRRGFKV
jgi:hypothetical protein